MFCNYLHGFIRITGATLAALFVLLGVSVALRPVAAAEPSLPVLEIGVVPYVGLGELIKAYSPLAVHLEKELGRPVRIVTGRNYQDYLQKSLDRAYPVVVTASHFGRLLETDAGYIPVLRPLTTFRMVILVRGDSSLNQLADLRSARIATPGVLAQTPMMGRAVLSANGVDTSGIQFIDAGNHKSALLAVRNGDADACFVSEGAFRHMNEEDRKGLRQIAVEQTTRRSSIPVIYAISPDVPPAERVRLTQLMLQYANELPSGRAWITGLKYEGLRPPSADEMKSLDGDVNELRQIFNPRGWRR